MIVVGALGACGCGGEDRPPVVTDESTFEDDDDDEDDGSNSRDDSSQQARDAGGDEVDASTDDESDDDSQGMDRGDAQASEADAGNLSDAGPEDHLAPRVEVLAPQHQEEPIEVFGDSLEGVCLIETAAGADAGAIDPSTVSFELLGDDGVVLLSAAGVRGEGPDVFVATFNTQNLSSGPVWLRCSASDATASARTSSAEVRTFLDHGPTILAITPEEGSPESALGAVAFEYEVEAVPLALGDAQAEITEVSLLVMGQRFPLIEQEGQPGRFRATVDFADPEVFEEVSTGPVQVAVSATTLRGTTATLRYEFVLDGTGPAIVIESPADTAIVGGTVVLQLEVTDAVSSVDWDSLVVRLNSLSFPYDPDGPWRVDGSNVTFTFETGEVTGSIEQITVNVNVDDVAGNPSAGAAVLYYRDEYGPIVSMDPPNYRGFDDDRGTCSLAFDPLGDSPANGQRVPDLAQYRALVLDRTNSAAGADVLHLAYTDPNSVDLFVRRHGEPLVIDTNGDGVCDDIAGEGARFQELTGLSPRGAAPHSALGDPDVAPEVLEGFCEFEDRNVDRLCRDKVSDLTIVVRHDTKATEPAVYAVSPNNDLECTGRRWELSSAGLSDYQGWVCLAVRAFDNVGNRGVSKPIAVCLDNGQVEGGASCTTDLDEAPPNCTDGCSDPPALPESGVWISL